MSPFMLDDYLRLRERSLTYIRRMLDLNDQQIDHDLRYEKLTGVNRLHNPEKNPAHFYFRDTLLEMIYLGGDALHDVSAADLQQGLDGAGTLLRSRAGKRANLHVYPEQGVAFSEEGGELDFIEIFPPTTLSQYQERIYKEPGAFIT